MLKKELLKKSSSHNEDFLTQSESSVSEVTDTDDEDIGQFNEVLLVIFSFCSIYFSLAIDCSSCT